MKNIKFSDNIKKMFRILKIVFQTSKGYFLSFISEAIFMSIKPYVSIFFTYLLLDGLIDGVPNNTIYLYIGLMIGLNFIIEGILKLVKYFKAHYVIELNYNLERKIAMKTFRMDFAHAEDKEVMMLIQKAEDGMNGNGGLPSYCEYVIGGSLMSILSIVYGFVLLTGLLNTVTLTNPSRILSILNSPYSALILLVALFVPSIISRFVMIKDNKKSYDVMIGNIDGNRRASYFFQICSNYKFGKDIRLFGMRDMIIESMQDQKNSVDNNWRGYVKFNIKMLFYTYFGNQFLAFIAYVFIGLKAMYGLISIGSVVSYVASITLISRSINTLVTRYSKMHLYNNYLDNFFTYLNLESKQVYGTIDFIDTNSLEIEFVDVSFKYPNTEQYILKDLNFKIKSKEKLAIVGPNGAGKSTLVKLLCRLYDVTKGNIYINHIPIQQYSRDAIYNLYSLVFQDFKLFSYSIEDNICLGEEPNKEKLDLVLEQSGISERISKMEAGSKTIIYQRNQEKGIEISGGEAQKIAVARALYKDSPFVILDEPTAALDPKSEAQIYEKYNHLVDNKSSIFISHRMSSTKFCDRILVLDNGVVVEHGNHKLLMKNTTGLYNMMWNAQAKYYKN